MYHLLEFQRTHSCRILHANAKQQCNNRRLLFAVSSEQFLIFQYMCKILLLLNTTCFMSWRRHCAVLSSIHIKSRSNESFVQELLALYDTTSLRGTCKTLALFYNTSNHHLFCNRIPRIWFCHGFRLCQNAALLTHRHSFKSLCSFIQGLLRVIVKPAIHYSRTRRIGDKIIFSPNKILLAKTRRTCCCTLFIIRRQFSRGRRFFFDKKYVVFVDETATLTQILCTTYGEKPVRETWQMPFIHYSPYVIFLLFPPYFAVCLRIVYSGL